MALALGPRGGSDYAANWADAQVTVAPCLVIDIRRHTLLLKGWLKRCPVSQT